MAAASAAALTQNRSSRVAGKEPDLRRMQRQPDQRDRTRGPTGVVIGIKVVGP